MKIAGKTDIGNKRKENQDKYISGKLNNGCVFAFVCDGMGGANGGQIASGIVVQNIEEIFMMKNDSYDIDDEETALDAITSANSKIYNYAIKQDHLKGMGTTISGFTIKNNQCTIYNVGDSRVYLYRNNILKQITEDHSVVQELYNQGIISEQEIRSHPQKNLITRAVGVCEEVDIDVYKIELEENDVLLCASDGLTNFVSNNEIVYVIKNQNFYDIPKILVESSLKNKATDNITAVLLKYTQ